MFSTALWTRNVRTFALFVVGRAEAPLLPAAMAGALEQKSTLGCDVFTSTEHPPRRVVATVSPNPKLFGPIVKPHI